MSIYHGTDNLEAMKVAENYNRFLIESLVGAAQTHRNILDFGAGLGSYAMKLRERGFEVACVEPDPPMAGNLTSKFKVYRDIEGLPDEALDFIYSLNVLEHLEDDLRAVRKLFTKLRPGGHLFLYVPAFDMLYSSMDRKVGHLRRYNRKQLRELMSKAGFAHINVRYADSLGFFITLLYKWLGSKKGDLNPIALKIFDSWIFPPGRLLDRLGLQYLLGKNLIAIACRPGG